ncbi:hypothetical protein, partial [Neisseria sp. P0014.S004]|uniref:hypothetical protein n=1 Tax=Neisseria sp. P0014.S004 TaxID=3436750 RepID=UPI003F7DB763
CSTGSAQDSGDHRIVDGVGARKDVKAGQGKSSFLAGSSDLYDPITIGGVGTLQSRWVVAKRADAGCARGQDE